MLMSWYMLMCNVLCLVAASVMLLCNVLCLVAASVKVYLSKLFVVVSRILLGESKKIESNSAMHF